MDALTGSPLSSSAATVGIVQPDALLEPLRNCRRRFSEIRESRIDDPPLYNQDNDAYPAASCVSSAR